MKRAPLALASVVFVCALTTSSYAGAISRDAVQITQDKAAASTSIGSRFAFTSTVRNTSSRALTGLVAHLNIVSLDSNVYVDPEDWSSHRTQYLKDIPIGGSLQQSWTVQAVNGGRFIVYVAVAESTAGNPVIAGPGLHVDVAAQRTINAGGILPIAAAVPVIVVELLVAARVRRRRLT
jgi:hypothetical protein